MADKHPDEVYSTEDELKITVANLLLENNKLKKDNEYLRHKIGEK